MLGFTPIASAPIASSGQQGFVVVTGLSLTLTQHSVSGVTGDATVTQSITNLGLALTQHTSPPTADSSFVQTNTNLALSLASSKLSGVTIAANDITVHPTSQSLTFTQNSLSGVAADATIAQTNTSLGLSFTLNSAPVVTPATSSSLTFTYNGATAFTDVTVAVGSLSLVSSLNSITLDFATLAIATSLSLRLTLNTRAPWIPITDTAGTVWTKIVP